MKLFAAIVASTALTSAAALAQTQPTPPAPQTPPGQARPAQPAAQAPAAAEFVDQATLSNMFEIQSSQLAVNRTQNDRVRQFGRRMVEDHTNAAERLKAAAPGQTMPTELDREHAQMLQTLQGASGPDFDRRYVQLQIRGHQDTVALFDRFAQNGDNPQLKQFAQQTLPALREHLQMAEQLRTALPPEQVGQAPGAATPPAGQPGQQQADGSRIVVQQAAPTVRVDQASPQVTVQQPQPTVTVRQPQPEIIVRQPQPTVTVDIPQPEIILRMPQPDVNVAMAQPQVQVNQAQPQVQVQRSTQQPQVQVERAPPQVNVQQAQGQPNVQMQANQEAPQVRYERAEPRIVVNAPQGQPQVRVERMGEGQQQAGAQQRPAQPATAQQQAAQQPTATGAVNATNLTVSRVTDMNLYNAQNEQLGEVERVVQGGDGKQYIVIGSGGFLGLGEKHVAIPTERVTAQGDRLIVQGLTNDQIKAMPTLDRNDRTFRDLEGNQPVQISAMR